MPTEDRKSENNTPDRKNHANSEKITPFLAVGEALDRAFSSYNNADMPEAERLCRMVLAEVPHQVDALQLLGLVLSQRGQYVEAVELLRQAIAQKSDNSMLHNNLGMALYHMEKTEEAVLEFRRAIELRPDFAKAYNNLGAVLMKLGRLDDAITASKKAICLQGDFKQAYNNLGLALKKKGSLTEAVAAYKDAVNLDPEYAEALSNLGLALIAQGKLKEAEENLQKAVRLAPDSAQFRNNLGVLFNRQGRFEEAIAASEKAIVASGNHLEAYNNLGTALMELERFSEANTAFEKAIAIDNECAEPHHNQALVLLLTGRFERGWDEYEWRWRHDGFSTPLRPFPQQWWNGSVDDVGKLLIWGEQGVGDEVQFSGLIRHVVAKGINVIVECDRRLCGLLQRSFPETPIIKRSDPPSELLKDSAITHQIPMCSIPRVLGLKLNETSFSDSYILPDPSIKEQLRSRYKADKKPLLVGISWKSGNSQEGPKRSVDLKYWGPILKIPGTRFVSLQYGKCSEQLQQSFEQFGVEILEDEKINPLTDLEGFAAQAAAMDLVISVDNSTVHFAGAMGVKVWTMLPTVPDWRWGLEGESTCWYPAMRLFRQADRGDWKPVVSRIAEELGSLVRLNESR
ncbi:MAG: tetratricopeptide repeat protein [Phycisphaerae bacterium]